MPWRPMASSSTAVPVTLTSEYRGRSDRSTPSPTMAAWWQTASTPASASFTVAGSRTSPTISSPSTWSGLPLCTAGVSESRPRTSWPAARMVSAICDPMKPAAPVTSTRMTAANHASSQARLAGGERHRFVRPDRPLYGLNRPAAEVLSVAMEIDVVLPCLNEAGALPWVLSRMPSGYRPIVADNGSTDDSAAIAAAYGAYVVPVPQRGFGAACHAGLLAASSDIVCVMDADASFDPGDLPLVADPVAVGDADLMLGWRSMQGKGAWPLHARIGNRVLAAELRRRIGVPVSDLGPMRAARREALLALPMSDRRFGYPLEMVVRAAEARWRIEETAVPYYPRTGKSKVTGTLGGTVRAVRDMRRVLASITAPAPVVTRVPVVTQASS